MILLDARKLTDTTAETCTVAMTRPANIKARGETGVSPRRKHTLNFVCFVLESESHHAAQLSLRLGILSFPPLIKDLPFTTPLPLKKGSHYVSNPSDFCLTKLGLKA